MGCFNLGTIVLRYQTLTGTQDPPHFKAVVLPNLEKRFLTPGSLR